MKPGYMTTEFWSTVLSAVWGIVSPLIPAAHPIHVIAPAVATAVYAIARAITKAATASAAGTAVGAGASAKAVENLHLGG